MWYIYKYYDFSKNNNSYLGQYMILWYYDIVIYSIEILIYLN